MLPPRIDYDYVISNPQIFDHIYQTLVPLEHRKKYGQFITPLPIAKFMVQWGIREGVSAILDPSVGPGVFLEEALRMSDNIELYGVDVDALALNVCALRTKLVNPRVKSNLILGDFLMLNPSGKKFDFIVCNPPYLNFHDFDRATIHKLENRLGQRLSKLTNIYSLFFMRSLGFLSAGGRIAFITPSEFLYTRYGQELKAFLLRNFTLESLLLFDFEKTAFKGALTTSIITLLRRSKPDPGHTVRLVKVSGWPDQSALMDIIDGKGSEAEGCKVSLIPLSQLNPREKWLIHFDNNGISSILSKLVPLRAIATVNRGIATGANEYFALTEDEVRQWKLEDEFVVPCITRAVHAPGYDYTREDFVRLREQGQKVFLLYCLSRPSLNLRHYLRHGEGLGIPARYLPRHRKPWYSSEKQEPAGILATVFSRRKMRFVRNEANVRALTAFHCVYPRFADITTVKAFLAFLNSSLCLKVQEVMRREYGGGLHKFEPGDLEQLPVLDVTALPEKDRKVLAGLFDELTKKARQGADETEVKSRVDFELTRIMNRMPQVADKRLHLMP
jgi:adenine-specific DNA-methyltransferase